MGTYKILVAAAMALMVFSVVGMMVKKYPKAMILCGIGFLLVFGPMSCAALTSK